MNNVLSPTGSTGSPLAYVSARVAGSTSPPAGSANSSRYIARSLTQQQSGTENEAYKKAQQLQKKATKELGKDIDIIYCNQAIISTNGDDELALKWLQEHANTFQVDLARRRNAAENLSRILGRPAALCIRALALSEDDIGHAMEILVSCEDSADMVLADAGHSTTAPLQDRSVEHDSKLDHLRSVSSDFPDKPLTFTIGRNRAGFESNPLSVWRETRFKVLDGRLMMSDPKKYRTIRCHGPDFVDIFTVGRKSDSVSDLTPARARQIYTVCIRLKEESVRLAS